MHAASIMPAVVVPTYDPDLYEPQKQGTWQAFAHLQYQALPSQGASAATGKKKDESGRARGAHEIKPKPGVLLLPGVRGHSSGASKTAQPPRRGRRQRPTTGACKYAHRSALQVPQPDLTVQGVSAGPKPLLAAVCAS